MKRTCLTAFLIAVIATTLFADDEPEQTKPEHSVARLSVINGDVSVRRGDSGDVVAASVNAPLLVEDRVLTASSSRAEIQFDSANMLRVASNSEVRLSGLQEGHYQIQIAIGTVTFRVLRNSEAQVELDTPILGLRPLGVGVYRVTVREDGSSDITIRDGEADVLSQSGSERLRSGSTMMARGQATDPEFQVMAAFGPDDWDRWNDYRDRDLERSRSYQYVSRDVSGAEDLDSYGRWVNDPSYGSVWAPTVAPGWAPYRQGRWVWEDYYGWTWVSYDPWGWAPYHYGRWFYGSSGWCWFPGGLRERHSWSPALVAFFGFGGAHIGVGFGFGNVGWVPLAPYESFRPWWGHGYGGGRAYINNTTIVNNINISNTYRNARVTNGITGVNATDFGRHTGQFTAVSGQHLQNAGLVRGVLPVTPDRTSLRFADRQVQNSSLPQARTNQFYGRSTPAQGQRVPFEQQQRNMDQAARGTYAGAGGRGISGGTTVQPSGSGAAQSTARGGWQRMSETPNSGQTRQNASPSESHAWQRFGEPVHGAGQANSTASQGRADAFNSRGATQNAPGNSGGGWQRFGGTGGSYNNPAPAQVQPRTEYSSPRGGGQQPPQSNGQPQSYSGGGDRSGWGRSNYQQAPSGSGYSAPRYESPRSSGSYGGGSQPVRISPSIVHERPSGGGGGGSRGGGGGGGNSSHSSGSSGNHGHGR